MLAALLALAVGSQTTGRLEFSSYLRPLPEMGEAYQRGFRSDAMVRINQVRDSIQVGEVRGDEPLQAFLNSFIDSKEQPASLELNEVFDAIQEEFPGAQYLAAKLVTSNDRESLLNELAGWSAATNDDFDTINTAVFQTGRQAGVIGVIGVMSRRIPAFSLREANSRGGRFFNKCPHCDEVHALEIEKESRTLILSCPHCELPFDVLASDTGGRIRRATDFFEGFSLDEHPVTQYQLTSEQRILALWREVAERCEYQRDQDHVSETLEVWKGPGETWADKAGDCEDTSILLADVLISAGFDARVAIGWNGNVGQHAWVVVRTSDRQYVIESTLQGEITEGSLKDVTVASAFYKPEQLFDRERMYFTTARPQDFNNDYFSPKVWRHIPVESVPAATPANGAKLSLR